MRSNKLNSQIETSGVYLEAEQDAQVPGRPVVEGIDQIGPFVQGLVQGLRLRLGDVRGELRRFIVVFVLGGEARPKVNGSAASVHGTYVENNTTARSTFPSHQIPLDQPISGGVGILYRLHGVHAYERNFTRSPEAHQVQ